MATYKNILKAIEEAATRRDLVEKERAAWLATHTEAEIEKQKAEWAKTDLWYFAMKSWGGGFMIAHMVNFFAKKCRKIQTNCGWLPVVI